MWVSLLDQHLSAVVFAQYWWAISSSCCSLSGGTNPMMIWYTYLALLLSSSLKLRGSPDDNCRLRLQVLLLLMMIHGSSRVRSPRLLNMFWIFLIWRSDTLNKGECAQCEKDWTRVCTVIYKYCHGQIQQKEEWVMKTNTCDCLLVHSPPLARPGQQHFPVRPSQPKGAATKPILVMQSSIQSIFYVPVSSEQRRSTDSLFSCIFINWGIWYSVTFLACVGLLPLRFMRLAVNGED